MVSIESVAKQHNLFLSNRMIKHSTLWWIKGTSDDLAFRILLSPNMLYSSLQTGYHISVHVVYFVT